MCGSRRSCLEAAGVVWKSWVVCGSNRLYVDTQVVFGSRKWCVEVVGRVWKSWVVCISHRWSVQGLALMAKPLRVL